MYENDGSVFFIETTVEFTSSTMEPTESTHTGRLSFFSKEIRI